MTSPHTSSCTYCGDAPVSHRLHFITSGINLAISSLFAPRTSKKPRFLEFTRSEVVSALTRALLHVLIWLRVITFNNNPEKVLSARTRSIWREMRARGAEMEQLRFFGLAREEMRALLPCAPGSSKRRWHYFESIPTPPWLETETGGWIDDKNLFKKVFEQHGLPIARGRPVAREESAFRAFQELTKPVITKPREGSRARHTTVNITNEADLRTGFHRAQELCPFVMIEEFATGSLYRATCVGRKVVGVIKFVKPEVVADGTKTVDELLAYHNAHKAFPNLTDVKRDGWYFDALSHQGLTPESVPPAGTRVLLSEHSERPNGGYFVDCTDEIPAPTRATIERAAEVCDVEVIGFDIISRDLTDPGERYTFIEGNTLPFIEIHDVPYAGTPRNAAKAVLDLWFRKED